MGRASCKRCGAAIEVSSADKQSGLVRCPQCETTFRIKGRTRQTPAQRPAEPVTVDEVPFASLDDGLDFPTSPSLDNVKFDPLFDGDLGANCQPYVPPLAEAYQPPANIQQQDSKAKSEDQKLSPLKMLAAGVGVLIGLAITRIVIPSLFGSLSATPQNAATTNALDKRGEEIASTLASSVERETTGKFTVTQAEVHSAMSYVIKPFNPEPLSNPSMEDGTENKEADVPQSGPAAYPALTLVAAERPRSVPYWGTGSHSLRTSWAQGFSIRTAPMIISDISQRFAVTASLQPKRTPEQLAESSRQENERRRLRQLAEKDLPDGYRSWDFNELRGRDSTVVDLVGGKSIGVVPGMLQRKRFARLSPNGQNLLSLAPLSIYHVNEPDEPLWVQPTRRLLGWTRPVPTYAKRFRDVRTCLLAATFVSDDKLLVVGQLSAHPDGADDQDYYLQLLEVSTGKELWRESLRAHLGNAYENQVRKISRFQKSQSNRLGATFPGLAVTASAYHDIAAVAMADQILLLRYSGQTRLIGSLTIPDASGLVDRPRPNPDNLIWDFERSIVIHHRGLRLSYLDTEQLVTWNLDDGSQLCHYPSPTKSVAPLMETHQGDVLLMQARFRSATTSDGKDGPAIGKSSRKKSKEPWKNPQSPIIRPSELINWKTGQLVPQRDLPARQTLAVDPSSGARVWCANQGVVMARNQPVGPIKDFQASTITPDGWDAISPSDQPPEFLFAPKTIDSSFVAEGGLSSDRTDRLSLAGADRTSGPRRNAVHWTKDLYDGQWLKRSCLLYSFRDKVEEAKKRTNEVMTGAKSVHPQGRWLAVASAAQPGVIDLFPWRGDEETRTQDIERYAFRVSNDETCQWLGWRDNQTLISLNGSNLSAWTVHLHETKLEAASSSTNSKPQFRIAAKLLWAVRGHFDRLVAITNTRSHVAIPVRSNKEIEFDPRTRRSAGPQHRIVLLDLDSGNPVGVIDTDGTVDGLEFDASRTHLTYFTRQSTDRISLVNLQDGSQRHLIASYLNPKEQPIGIRTIRLNQFAFGANESLYVMSDVNVRLKPDTGEILETPLGLCKIGNRPGEILGDPESPSVGSSVDQSTPEAYAGITAVRSTPVSVHVEGLSGRACRVVARQVADKFLSQGVPIGPGGFEVHAKMQYSNNGTVQVAGAYLVKGGRPPAPSVMIRWDVKDSSGHPVHSRVEHLRATHTIYTHIKPGQTKLVNVSISPKEWREMEEELLQQICRGQLRCGSGMLATWYKSQTVERSSKPKL